MPSAKEIECAVAPSIAYCVIEIASSIERVATSAHQAEGGFRDGARERRSQLTNHVILPVLRMLQDWLRACRDEATFRDLLLALDAKKRPSEKPLADQINASSLDSSRVADLYLPDGIVTLWYVCQGDPKSLASVSAVLGEGAKGAAPLDIKKASRACMAKIEAQIAKIIPTSEAGYLGPQQELFAVLGAVNQCFPELGLLPSPLPNTSMALEYDRTVSRASKRLMDMHTGKQIVSKGGGCSIL